MFSRTTRNNCRPFGTVPGLLLQSKIQQLQTVLVRGPVPTELETVWILTLLAGLRGYVVVIIF